jgi:hypothetical protein
LFVSGAACSISPHGFGRFQTEIVFAVVEGGFVRRSLLFLRRGQQFFVRA